VCLVLGNTESLKIRVSQVKLVLKIWVTGFDPNEGLVEKVTVGQVVT